MKVIPKYQKGKSVRKATAYIDNRGQIIFPHPYLYKRKQGGKIG